MFDYRKTDQKTTLKTVIYAKRVTNEMNWYKIISNIAIIFHG